MKEKFLSIRIDEPTLLQFKELSQRLNLNGSEFIRKLIQDYEKTVEQLKAGQQGIQSLEASEKSVQQLTNHLEAYQKIEELNELFKKCRGKTINGKVITHPTHLISALVSHSAVEIIEPSEPAGESSLEIIIEPMEAESIPVETVEFPSFRQLPAKFWWTVIGILGTIIGVIWYWRRTHARNQFSALPYSLSVPGNGYGYPGREYQSFEDEIRVKNQAFDKEEKVTRSKTRKRKS